MKLFGYNITKTDLEKEENNKQTFSTIENTDGTVEVETEVDYASQNRYILDLEVEFKDEKERVDAYRKASKHPDVAIAIDEIINEAIVNEDNSITTLSLDNTDISEPIKKKIVDEFEYILGLFDFNLQAEDIFKRWYVDGKIYYHKVIAEKGEGKKEGIVELRYLDPRKIKKVREVIKGKNGVENTSIKEYYVYSFEKLDVRQQQSATFYKETKGVEIQTDMISFAHSGLNTYGASSVIESYLDKALKPLNQLTNLEDSVVVYRVSRAPERRVFYIGVGNLPKTRAEQYMKSIIEKYKNKTVYDSRTGTFTNNKNQISMMEDFWLPRREDGKSTEIDTLPSAQNLGEMDDVNYFKNRLYKALHLPLSRFSGDDNMMGIGRGSEITRDEVKFSKFVKKLQIQFSQLILDALHTQLILKKVLTDEDWEKEKQNINLVFNTDSFYTELKQAEILTERLTLLDTITDHVGKYFSIEYVQRNILMMTDNDIKDMADQIATEIKDGKLPDPTKQEEEASY